MNISITISEITSSAKNRLSLIAKRAQTEKGNPSFVNITLGSAEIGILNELASDGANYLGAELANIVSQCSIESSDTIIFVISDKRATNAAVSFLQTTMKSYVVNHVLAEYLSMYSKEFADTFVNKRQADLDNLIEFAYTKTPYVSETDFNINSGKIV